MGASRRRLRIHHWHYSLRVSHVQQLHLYGIQIQEAAFTAELFCASEEHSKGHYNLAAVERTFRTDVSGAGKRLKA